MLEYIRTINAKRQSEDGASAVEYGLLVAGIAALVVAIVFAFGGIIKGAFTDTCDTIATKDASTATTSASCA